MVLGALDPNDSGDPFNAKLKAIDDLLGALYGNNPPGMLGCTKPSLRKWLEGIRKHFPPQVVGVLQRDAFERLGLRQMLLEPELLEKLEPSVSLVADVLLLRESMPDKTQRTARAGRKNRQGNRTQDPLPPGSRRTTRQIIAINAS